MPGGRVVGPVCLPHSDEWKCDNSTGRISLLRGPAGPAFERVVECARFPVAQKPCDFSDWQAPLSEVALGKVKSQLVQHSAECHPFSREAALERSWANSKPLRDFGDSGAPMRQ